jgi:hypothetical protein
MMFFLQQTAAGRSIGSRRSRPQSDSDCDSSGSFWQDT